MRNATRVRVAARPVPMVSRKAILTLAVLTSVLALAACGDSDAKRMDAALQSDLAMASTAPGMRSGYASPMELGYPQAYPPGYQAPQYGYPAPYPPGYPQPYPQASYPPQPYGYPQPVAQRAPTQVIYRDRAPSGGGGGGASAGSGAGSAQGTESNTKRGAIIGAATGAAVGIATQRDKVKGGAVGAITGAVLGGVVGSQIYTKPRTRPY